MLLALLSICIQSSIQEPQSFNYIQSHRYSSWFHFCNQLHTLSFNLQLQSHNSCWTKCFVSFAPIDKLYTFRNMFYTLFGTQTRAWLSLIVLKLSKHLLTLTLYGLRRVSLKFIWISVGIAWHGFDCLEIHVLYVLLN